MGLTRAAIARPVFVLMLMLAAFLIGALSYKSMRLELNPEVNFGVVTVQTTYPGANPDTINTQISRKIEEAVSSVSGLREVTSTSTEGFSSVVVTLEIGTNADAALNDVRSKVDSIVNSLPKDALKPQVSKFDMSSSPVLTLSFSSSKLSSQQLRDLIDDKLADRFAQINGVASAAVQGGDTREIQVRLRPDKLLSYGIGIADVTRAIQSANIDAPGGRLRTKTQEYTVRVYNQYESVDQIKKLVLNVSDPNNPQAHARSVNLTDVADVVDTIKDRTAYSRVNGKDAIVLAIQKTLDGNAVEITNTANGIIASIQKEYAPQDIKIEKTLQVAKQIEDSLNDLNFALMFGIFLVAVIVFVFLHNFRGTLIVALAIPTSIFASFIALKAAGFTINNMSMLALSLAIGVLVDDAIVVLENIYRHLKMGEDPRDAAINGRSEIGLAAIAITMADVVVFLPIAFMGGVVGQFFKPLALTFVFATLFSLFVSFTLTPMLASRWYRRGEDMEHPTGRFAMWFEKRFAGLEHAYRRSLEWALNHRWFVFLSGNVLLFAVFMFIAGSVVPTSAPKGVDAKTAAAAAFGVAGAFKTGMGLLMVSLFIAVITTVVNLVRRRGFSLKYVLAGLAFGLVFPVSSVIGYEVAQWKKEAVFKGGFLPDSDSGQVLANIELPPGSSLEQTQAVVNKIEAVMMANSDVKYTIANVGTQGVGTFSSSNNGPNYGQVSATLYDKAAVTDKLKKQTERLRYKSSDEVSADILLKVGRIPGAKVNISAGSAFGFGAAIQLSLTSDDRAALLSTAQTIRSALASGAVPGVISPDISSKPGKPEIRATPDPRRIADAGTTVNDVANSITTFYQGNTDSKLRVNGREYDIDVMMNPEDRDKPDLIDQVPVAFKQGQPVFLGRVADIGRAPGIDKITRRNRSEEVLVTANLLPGYANGTVQAQIDSYIKANHLVPDDVTYKPLGQADAQAREMVYMVTAFFTGIVLVYMLLASLYDNLLYPFIIQLAQPQAMVGALLALIITNKPMSLVGFIGLVSLVGLVGKNAILVVDYTNTLRDRGRNRHDALVEAGPTRLRPIMMTTLALILGMMPVALALGRGSEFRETIGITIIGGITLSTLLTLLVIPCSYTIFDDLSIGIGRGMSWFFGLFNGQKTYDPDLLPQDGVPPTLVDPENPSVPPRIQ